MKRAYYYLFYKFYKLWDNISFPKFWSDWKAGISIIFIEILCIYTIVIYYNIFVNRYFELKKTPMIIVTMIICATNYMLFVHTDAWKEYVKEFDKLPKRTNRIGSWIVFGIVLFIIINLVFSFYLMSRIDWSLYRT